MFRIKGIERKQVIVINKQQLIIEVWQRQLSIKNGIVSRDYNGL